MYKNMPKRPKQHQVEDLSITAFKNLLPREWVFREKDRDYGIDGEVEIFTSSGEATGLIFYVQLKATDSLDLTGQRRVQLKIETINYFRELPLSILIVRYAEQSKDTYIKWSFEIDLFGIKDNAKTFSFAMNEGNLWIDNTPSLVYETVNNIRNIENCSSLFPLKLKLNFSFNSILEYTPYEIKSYIRDYIENSGSSHIVNIVNSEKDTICIIEADNDKLLSSIIGFQGTVLDDYLQLEYLSIDDFIATIFVAISMSLFKIGKDANAKTILNELVMRNDEIPLILQHPEISFFIIENYLNLHEEEKAFTLWEKLSKYFNDDEDEYLLLALYPKYKKFTIRVLKEKIIQYKESNDLKSAGIYSYNLANKLHNDSLHREAVKYYNQSLKCFPHYCKEDYVFKELAGSLFELRRYKLSTKLYKFGLELNYDKNTSILYADALMFTGDYHVSLEKMIKYGEKYENIEGEWILKIFILEFIVNVLKIKKQKRNYLKSMQYLDSYDENNISEEILLEAIKLDTLSPLAWYNLAQFYSKEKKYEKALFGFLITSLVNGYDPEAWYNSVVYLIYTENIELLESVIRTGYRKTGEEFIRLVYGIGDKIDFDGMDDFLDRIIEEENKQIDPIVRVYDGTKFERIV
jgi:tetratricopeptide (TPR) repeat protein